jgi:hypothetical protein
MKVSFNLTPMCGRTSQAHESVWSTAMDFATARRIALNLAGSVEQPHFHFGSWRVAGRIYATVPPEQTHLHVFVDEAQRAAALLLEPGAVVPLHWGHRVVGVRVDLELASAELIGELLTQAWQARACLKPLKQRTTAAAKRR